MNRKRRAIESFYETECMEGLMADGRITGALPVIDRLIQDDTSLRCRFDRACNPELTQHGGDRRNEKGKDQGSIRTLKRGDGNAPYLTARLARDRPDIVRRLGELQAAGPKSGGGNPNLTGNTMLPVVPTLSDKGITKMESSRWQAAGPKAKGVRLGGNTMLPPGEAPTLADKGVSKMDRPDIVCEGLW